MVPPNVTNSTKYQYTPPKTSAWETTKRAKPSEQFHVFIDSSHSISAPFFHFFLLVLIVVNQARGHNTGSPPHYGSCLAFGDISVSRVGFSPSSPLEVHSQHTHISPSSDIGYRISVSDIGIGYRYRISDTQFGYLRSSASHKIWWRPKSSTQYSSAATPVG